MRAGEVDRIERELGVTLSNPVIAYIAAGVSAWGDGPIVLRAIPEKTLSVRELAVEREGMTERDAARVIVIDDDSNGNYIAVEGGEPKDSDMVYFLDHESGFALDDPLSLSQAIAERVEDRNVTAKIEPFGFDLVDEPEPVSRKVVRTVRHAKFGVGTVVVEEGENVTVKFAKAGTKRLKRSFLVFD